MRVVLDTHTFLWFIDGDAALSPYARQLIEDRTNERLLSIASLWEMAIKVGLGKLSLSLPYRHWMGRAIADLNLSILPITVEYADRQAVLPHHHRDPFDRLLIAQSLTDAIPIVTADAQFNSYGIVRIW